MKQITLLNAAFYLLIFLFIMPFHSFAGPVSSYSKNAFPVIERDTTHDTIREYETQLDFLNSELLNLRMDREWICLKIARIQDQNRLIPQRLKEYRINLTKKIIGAVKNKNRLIKLIKEHQNSIKQLNRQINNVKDLDFFHSQAPLDKASQEFPTANLEKKLQSQIEKAKLQNAVEMIHDDSGLILKTTFPILFDSCQYTMKNEYKIFSSKLAFLLKHYDLFIDIQGFTDDIKIKGNYMTNIELSAKRAGAVVRELQKNGMKDSIFKITGMGEYRKCVKNRVICRALSRRVDITVHFNTFGS